MKISSPSQRRDFLLNRMSTFNAQGASCVGCAGNCCTFEANSMEVTPLEALDLVTSLYLENRDLTKISQELRDAIKTFRLDRAQPGNGQRSFLRRTYTCPFFKQTALGCSITKEFKPYGCLNFNPHQSGKQGSESCWTDAHPKRDEDSLNLEIKIKMKLDWDKATIPVAVLDMLEKFSALDQSPSAFFPYEDS